MQDPPPAAHLAATRPWGLDLHLEVDARCGTTGEPHVVRPPCTGPSPSSWPTSRRTAPRRGRATCSAVGTVSRTRRRDRGQPDRAHLARDPADHAGRRVEPGLPGRRRHGHAARVVRGDGPERPRIGFGECTGTIGPAPSTTAGELMPYYRAVGDVPRKRHTIARRGGNVLHEELMGTEGFSSASAAALPPALAVGHRRGRGRARPDGGDVHAQRPAPAPPPPHDRRWSRTGAVALLGNDDVVVTIARVAGETELYRNAGGDELVYVQSGQAVLASVFGRLAVGPGDYVVIPTSHDPPLGGRRRRRAARRPGHRELAATSRRPASTCRRAASSSSTRPYCERDLRAPGEPLLEEGEDVDVLVRHRAGLTRFRYATHPFDVVGWDGALYPWAFNISRLRADRRAPAPAAARAPDLRAPQRRRVLVRAPPVRLPPRGRQGAVPPRQRRLRRGALLLARATS